MNNRFIENHSWYLVWIAGFLSLGLALPIVHSFRQEAPSNQLSDSPYLRIDPAKMVLSERDTRIPCGECHALEYDVWKETPHATGFSELHRSEKAQDILDRMGFRLAKRESLCLRCHYTAILKREQARAIAGISCESCHGAARDWLDVHNDYGGATHDTELAEQRRQRLERSIEGGMLRPSEDLYAVAANCFECHTVPNETLINVGGHASGSNFDLVDWADQIRHNFLQAQWSNDETNRLQTPERKRLMYAIGSVLNYEYSIRAVAAATEPGNYAKAMERRVKGARRALEKVYRVAPLADIQAILLRGRDLRYVPNNKAALLAAADDISTRAQQLARAHDGTRLAALDPLIAGKPIASAEDEPADEEPSDEEIDEPVDPATGEPETTEPATEEAGETVRVVGRQRRRPAWFAAVTNATLGPSSGCSCHNDQFEWWDADPHSRSAEPLLNQTSKAVHIARTYGLTLTQMKRGNRICMNCHGTIVTGDEAEEVFDGVSCENCHGPGEAYDRKHELDPPPRGYVQGAALGMVNLEDVAARADNCTRCHHITDERLISSGHPTGEGFDLGRRDEDIQHWTSPTHSAGDLNAAYRRAVQRRPIPQNIPIATPPAEETPPPLLSSEGRVRRGTSSSRSDRARQARFRPPRVRPSDRFTTLQAGDLESPLLSLVSDSTTTEDILLLVKQRLEVLYKALGRGQ
ncbi:MAG: multiheme c-type cytochrome [Rhodothermales bacterium]